MSKRFQIPATPSDQRLFQSAARRAGLSAAEWARRLLRKEAELMLKDKTWDHLFADLAKVPETDDLVAPERGAPRSTPKSEDDWG